MAEIETKNNKIVHVVLSGGSPEDLLGVYTVYNGKWNSKFKHNNDLQLNLRMGTEARLLGVFNHIDGATDVVLRDIKNRYICSVPLQECELETAVLKY